MVAQLIRASDSAHLWSGKYDRPLDDYFEVQDDIAGHIMRALKPHLEAGELPESTSQTQISPALFERFVAARQRYYDFTQPAFQEAHEEFLAITEAARVELERLRHSGMTAPELRADYLARKRWL